MKTSSSCKKINNHYHFRTNLNKIVEQDNVTHLRELDQNTKLIASLATLNVPLTFNTGQSYYRKDDDDNDDNQQGGRGFDDGNNFNRFIM